MAGISRYQRLLHHCDVICIMALERGNESPSENQLSARRPFPPHSGFITWARPSGVSFTSGGGPGLPR